MPGLSITRSGSRAQLGSVSEPEVLTGLARASSRRSRPTPTSAPSIGPTTILRMIRYLGGAGRRAGPTDPDGARADGRRPRRPGAAASRCCSASCSRTTLAQTQLTVITPHDRARGLPAPRRAPSARHWDDDGGDASGARASFELQTVGLGPLHAKMAQNLVPTLVESFALTVVDHLRAFLVVFRSGTARLMAMIPSIFAILVMFLVMRLCGMRAQHRDDPDRLDGARHVGERSDPFLLPLPREAAGRHGRAGAAPHAARRRAAIVFATLINAGGFLAFALSRSAADAPVRRAHRARLRAVDARRLHRAAGGAVDPLPRETRSGAGRRGPAADA